jgi:hypothetical protein
MWTTKVFSQRQSFRVPNSSSAPRSLARILSLEDPKPKSKQSPSVSIPTVKALCECLLWGEYFNSMLKCWEPLLDPFVATFLHEQVCLNQSNLIHSHTMRCRIIKRELVTL